MKALVLIALAAIMLSSSVSAFGWMEKFYEEKQVDEEETDIPGCGDVILVEETQWWNNQEYVLELANVGEDGYYVLHLTGNPFRDTHWLTARKYKGEISWVSAGVCAPEGEYRYFETDLDINLLEAKLREKYQTRNMDPFDEGYAILRKIEGITWPEKIKLIMVGSKILAENTLGGTPDA